MGDAQVRRHYDELSAVYDRDRNQRYFQRAVDRYLDLLGPAPGRVLEIGCGTGSYLIALRQRGIDAVGIDLSPRMCEVARARLAAAGVGGEGVVACADAELDFVLPGPFDRIVFMDCWEFLPEPRRALELARRALSTSGRVLILTPNALARPLIELLEALRIKSLRPAFQFGNSRVAATRRVAEGLFDVVASGTLFGALERYFVLVPAPSRAEAG